MLIDQPRYGSKKGTGEKKKEIDISEEDFADVLRGIDLSQIGS